MLWGKRALVAAFAASAAAHDHTDDQQPIEGPHKQLWYNTLPGDGGTQVSFTKGLESGFWLIDFKR